MTITTSSASDENNVARRDVSARVGFWLLSLICLSFLALRVPVMYLQPGGQDEECYAVPGWTILRTGLPQLPHIPARNAESVYYGADLELYSEPPAYFYYQALFYAVLPGLYGTGRLASGMAALATIVLVYWMTLRFSGRVAAALWAAALYSISRWFLFPATCARPDILCTVFGLVSLLIMDRSYQSPARLAADSTPQNESIQLAPPENENSPSNSYRWKYLLVIGLCIGLGGLTHPFAIVYAVQLAVWAALNARGWQRLLAPLVMALVSILIACTWLPLIWQHLDIFRIQFHNQFSHDAGGGLFLRMISPWESFHYHWFRPEGMVPHIGIWQILLTFIPLFLVTIESLRSRDRQLRTLSLLAWSSIYLISVIVGPHHPVLGYWSYTAALMFVCTGRYVDKLMVWCRGLKSKFNVVLVAGLSIALFLAMVPGAGLRTLYAVISHRNDINYNAPAFAAKLIDSLPPDAVVAVDREFAFDFLVRGRKVIGAIQNPMYFCLDQFEYDYVIVSRAAIDQHLVEQLPIVLERTHGNRDDIFACYCEVYRRSKISDRPQTHEPVQPK